VKELILLILGTDPIMVVRGRMVVQGRTTAQGMQLTQAPLRSRLATGRITIAVAVITWAGRIMFGDRDIGDGAMVKESGSTDTTF
jgi:hypothetical protein